MDYPSMDYTLKGDWRNNMSIDLRQLHDDLAAYYPITCVQAVIGGNVMGGSSYEETDCSHCINTDAFSGSIIGQMYGSTEKGRLVIINVDLSVNDGYQFNLDGDIIIATNIGADHYNPIVFKTITDDTSCKVNVLLDTDDKLKLCIIPNNEVVVIPPPDDETPTGVYWENVVNITRIKATGVIIYQQIPV